MAVGETHPEVNTPVIMFLKPSFRTENDVLFCVRSTVAANYIKIKVR